MLALGRLLRISLAPSAAADVAAGTVLAAGLWPAGWSPFVLMLASLCVYHGGMALNDWADRDEDARSGRARPIASGAIPARRALLLGAGLLLGGPLLALLAAPRCALALGAVALLAAFYDLAGRGPWLGPLLLALCRAGNLGAGLLLGLAADTTDGRVPLQVVLLYGLYVFYVSRLARLEDAGEEALARGRPARALCIAALLLAVLGLPRLVLLFSAGGPAAARWPAWLGACAGAGIALAGAFGLLRQSLRRLDWSRGDVMAAVGQALRRLLVGSAAVAAQAGSVHGLLVAGAILLGYPLSFGLRRVFPPT